MNEDEIRKRKLVFSPAREKHDTTLRPKQSPHKLLRMMSQFKPVVEKVSSEPATIDQASNSRRETTVKPPLVSKTFQSRYSELQKRYDALPVLSARETALENVPKVQLLRHRARHEDIDSDNMSNSYHSNTNYSRLDYRPPQTMEDDVMSIATQDMLIDEDNASIVLDTQTISALRRARDEEVELPFHATLPASISSQASRYSTSVHSTRLPSIPPPQQQQQEHNSVYSRSAHGTSESSLHRSATSISSTPRDTPSVQNGLDLGPPRSVHSDDHLPSLLHEDEDDREQSIPADRTPPPPPPPPSSGEQKEEAQDLQLNKGIQVNDFPDLVDKPLVPNDFRASHDLMNDDNPVADTNWGDDDYGQSWSDNELNDTTYPQTGILPGTFEMNQTRPHITLHKAITGKETKRLFEQRMPHNMKSFVPANELVKIKNMYFDQLVSDLQQSKENSTSLTTNDVLLLMKRQQILNDRTSISLLARKHLPREYSDRLCQAAIKYNDVYPS